MGRRKTGGRNKKIINKQIRKKNKKNKNKNNEKGWEWERQVGGKQVKDRERDRLTDKDRQINSVNNEVEIHIV